MRKYAVDINFNWKGCYDAGPKARVDVSRTLKKAGYKIICIRYPEYRFHAINSLFRKLQFIWLYIRYLRKADCILFQYPGAISLWLLEKIKRRGVKTILLIHDIESIREERIFNEKTIFNYADFIISHTRQMEEVIKNKGVTSTIQNIYLFDYYINNKDVYKEKELDTITFCGNLNKSAFIKEFSNSKCHIKTFLYGKGDINNTYNSNINYMGFFDANDISNIKGGWGLVWDGDSIHGCDTSAMGRYLKYNSSHKASLYIVAEKPLIVWEGSALAEYVKKEQIGITINSLLEIESKIKNITNDEYEQLIKRIRLLKEKLTSGTILSEVINKIENE